MTGSELHGRKSSFCKSPLLVAANVGLVSGRRRVDGQDKPGHDGKGVAAQPQDAKPQITL